MVPSCVIFVDIFLFRSNLTLTDAAIALLL